MAVLLTILLNDNKNFPLTQLIKLFADNAVNIIKIIY